MYVVRPMAVDMRRIRSSLHLFGKSGSLVSVWLMVIC